MDREIVGYTLRCMARNKATGLDEWRMYEMRAWPTHLLNATAEWPEELAGPLGILLGKRRRTRWIEDRFG